MQLIWDNYKTFNLSGSDIYVVKIKYEDAFHKQFAKMFKINLVYNEDYLIYREHNVLGKNEKMEVSCWRNTQQWRNDGGKVCECY